MPKPNFTDFLDLGEKSKSKSASRRGAVAAHPGRTPASRKGGKIRIIDSDAEVANPIASKSSRGWFGSFYRKPHAPAELEAQDGVIVEPLLDSDSSYVASLAQVSEAIAQNQSPVRSERVKPSPPGVVPVVAPPVGNPQPSSILPSAPAELKVVPAPQATTSKPSSHHVIPGSASPNSAGVRRFATQSTPFFNQVAPPIVAAQALRNKQGMASFTAQKITITNRNNETSGLAHAAQANSHQELEGAALKSRLTPHAPPLNPSMVHSELSHPNQAREVSVFAARRAQEQARSNNQRATGLGSSSGQMNFGRGMAFRDSVESRNESVAFPEGDELSSSFTHEPTRKRKFASAIDLATSLLAKALSKSEESANSLANLAALSYFSTHGIEVAAERDATIDTTPLFKPVEGMIAPPVMAIAAADGEYLKQFSIDSRVVLPTAQGTTNTSLGTTSLALGQLGQISTPLATASIEKADACEVAGVQANLPSGVSSASSEALDVVAKTAPEAEIVEQVSPVVSTSLEVEQHNDELVQRAQAVSTASNVSKARASTSSLKTKIITPPALRAFAFKTKDSASNVNVDLVNALTTSQAHSQTDSVTQGVRIFAPSLGAGAARGVQALNFGLDGFDNVTKNQQLEEDLASLGAPSSFMSKLGVFGPDGERIRQQKEQAKQQKIEFDALALERWVEQQDEPEYYGQDFYVEDGSVRPMPPNNMCAQDRQTTSEYFDLRLENSTGSTTLPGYNENELDVLMQSFTADAQGNDNDKARNLAEQSFTVPEYCQNVCELGWEESELEEMAELYDDEEPDEDLNKGFNANFAQASQLQSQGQGSLASALASKSRADALRGASSPRAYAAHDKFATRAGDQLEKNLAAQADNLAMQGLVNRRKSNAMQQPVSAEVQAIAASLTAHEPEFDQGHKHEVAHSQPLFVENEQQVFATQVYSSNRGETFIIKIPTKTVDPLQQNKIPHAAQMADVTVSEAQAYDELVRRVTSGFIPPPVFVNGNSAITNPLSPAQASSQKEQRVRNKPHPSQTSNLAPISNEQLDTQAQLKSAGAGEYGVSASSVPSELDSRPSIAPAHLSSQVTEIPDDKARTAGLGGSDATVHIASSSATVKHVVSAQVETVSVAPASDEQASNLAATLPEPAPATLAGASSQESTTQASPESATYHAYIGEPQSYATVDTSTLAERKIPRSGMLSPIAQQLMQGEQQEEDSAANETVSIVKGHRSFQGVVAEQGQEALARPRSGKLDLASFSAQEDSNPTEVGAKQLASTAQTERANAKILTRIQELESSATPTLASETFAGESLDLSAEFATLGMQFAEVENQLQALENNTPSVPPALASVYNEAANYGKVSELHAQSSRTGLSLRQEDYRDRLDGQRILCLPELDLLQMQQHLWLIQEEFQVTRPEQQLTADQRMELRHQHGIYTEDGFKQRSFNVGNVLPVPNLTEQEIIYHLLASEFIDFTEDEELIRAIRRNYAQIADLLIEHARTKARQEQNRLIVEQILQENALRQAGYNQPPSIGNALAHSRQQVYSSMHNFAGITEPLSEPKSQLEAEALGAKGLGAKEQLPATHASNRNEVNRELGSTPLAHALASSLGNAAGASQVAKSDMAWRDLVQSLGSMMLDELSVAQELATHEDEQRLGLNLEDTEIIFADRSDHLDASHHSSGHAPSSATASAAHRTAVQALALDLPIAMHADEVADGQDSEQEPTLDSSSETSTTASSVLPPVSIPLFPSKK